MSQRITIEIKDKIATCLTELPIVCGNSDYVIDFKFDEEWNAHEVKTAIFVINGKSIEQVFAGTVCPIPVIQNTLITWVGVFAGTINDGTLSTSTPALVKCAPCITDGDKVPLAPPDDVYNQIIQLINDGMIKGDKGDKGEKGEKGDAGAIKFISVTSLPTENIETDAIYLVPVPDSTEEENRFNEYAYNDGEWEQLGAVSVQVDHSQYPTKEEVSNTYMEKENTTETWLAGQVTLYGTMRDNKGVPSYARQYVTNNPVAGRIPRWSGRSTLLTATPQEEQDCANKKYVDDLFAQSGGSGTSDDLSLYLKIADLGDHVSDISATSGDINKRVKNKVITPEMSHYAVKQALINSVLSWDDTDHSKACSTLGTYTKKDIDGFLAEIRALIGK